MEKVMNKNYIEISGTPKSGKDYIINLLVEDKTIVNKDLRIYYEDISTCGIDKSNVSELMYWTSCNIVCKAMEAKISEKIIEKNIIFNRGLFDRLAWLETYKMLSSISDITYNNLKELIINSQNLSEIKLLMIVSKPELALKRDPRIQNNKSKKRIMNIEFLHNLNMGYDIAFEKYKKYLKEIVYIDEKKVEISTQMKYETLRDLYNK